MSQDPDSPRQWEGGTADDNYWRVAGASTGVVQGMNPRTDDRLSSMVFFQLHLEDLGKPAKFVLTAEAARTLADFLNQAAETLEKETP